MTCWQRVHMYVFVGVIHDLLVHPWSNNQAKRKRMNWLQKQQRERKGVTGEIKKSSKSFEWCSSRRHTYVGMYAISNVLRVGRQAGKQRKSQVGPSYALKQAYDVREIVRLYVHCFVTEPQLFYRGTQWVYHLKSLSTFLYFPQNALPSFCSRGSVLAYLQTLKISIYLSIYLSHPHQTQMQAECSLWQQQTNFWIF